MLHIVAISMWHALPTDELGVLVDNIVQRLASSQNALLIHHHHIGALLSIPMDHTHAIPIAIVVAIPIAIGTVSSVISVAVVHRDRPGRWLLRCSPLGRESQLMGVVVLLPAAGGGRDVDVNVAYGPRCGFVAAWPQSLFPHLPHQSYCNSDTGR